MTQKKQLKLSIKIEQKTNGKKETSRKILLKTNIVKFGISIWFLLALIY